MLSLICRLHHVANRLPFQLEQPVKCSKNKPAFDIPQNPHTGFGACSDFKSGVRKCRSERANLQRFGPHLLNSSAGSRKIEIKTLGAVSARARNR
jgi:hypothetical protein